MGPAIPYIVAAVVTTAYSVQQQKKSSEAIQESSEQSSASEQVSQQAQTRQQVRQNRIRRAQLAQTAQSSGAGTSSASAGTASQLSTDLSANLAFQQGQTNTANNITALNQQASDFNTNAQIGSALTNFALLGAQSQG